MLKNLVGAFGRSKFKIKKWFCSWTFIAKNW